MKKRWLIYTGIGIVFGILDFYYPDFFPNFHPHFSSELVGGIFGFLSFFGVWLIPFVPLVLYEGKKSKSKVLPAAAGALTWSVSVVIYYLTTGLQLAFGNSSQPYMNFSNRNSLHFWENWQSQLSILFTNTIQWVIFAIISGFIIGAFINLIFLAFSRN